ncbi:hypothetical protein DIPPA_27177 [Diplonema papillatum]|nr:hypothetical protein DIPPA_27177 [Diplonema papillatum]
MARLRPPSSLIDPDTGLAIADYSSLPQDCHQPFQKMFETDAGLAALYFLAEVQKFNKSLAQQRRVLCISRHAIFLCTPKAQVLRCTKLQGVKDVYTHGNTFALKVPEEYDLMLNTADTNKHPAPACARYLRHVLEKLIPHAVFHSDQEWLDVKSSKEARETCKSLLQLARPATYTPPKALPREFFPWRKLVLLSGFEETLDRVHPKRALLLRELKTELEVGDELSDAADGFDAGPQSPGSAPSPAMGFRTSPKKLPFRSPSVISRGSPVVKRSDPPPPLPSAIRSRDSRAPAYAASQASSPASPTDLLQFPASPSTPGSTPRGGVVAGGKQFPVPPLVVPARREGWGGEGGGGVDSSSESGGVSQRAERDFFNEAAGAPFAVTDADSRRVDLPSHTRDRVGYLYGFDDDSDTHPERQTDAESGRERRQPPPHGPEGTGDPESPLAAAPPGYYSGQGEPAKRNGLWRGGAREHESPEREAGRGGGFENPGAPPRPLAAAPGYYSGQGESAKRNGLLRGGARERESPERDPGRGDGVEGPAPGYYSGQAEPAKRNGLLRGGARYAHGAAREHESPDREPPEHRPGTPPRPLTAAPGYYSGQSEPVELTRNNSREPVGAQVSRALQGQPRAVGGLGGMLPYEFLEELAMVASPVTRWNSRGNPGPETTPPRYRDDGYAQFAPSSASRSNYIPSNPASPRYYTASPPYLVEEDPTPLPAAGRRRDPYVGVEHACIPPAGSCRFPDENPKAKPPRRGSSPPTTPTLRYEAAVAAPAPRAYSGWRGGGLDPKTSTAGVAPGRAVPPTSLPSPANRLWVKGEGGGGGLSLGSGGGAGNADEVDEKARSMAEALRASVEDADGGGDPARATLVKVLQRTAQLLSKKSSADSDLRTPSPRRQYHGDVPLSVRTKATEVYTPGSPATGNALLDLSVKLEKVVALHEREARRTRRKQEKKAARAAQLQADDCGHVLGSALLPVPREERLSAYQKELKYSIKPLARASPGPVVGQATRRISPRRTARTQHSPHASFPRAVPYYDHNSPAFV